MARAIRAETLDRAAVEAVFDRHDEAIDKVRQRVLEEFAKIHETLDERQRKSLADIVEFGPFGHGFGPFRRG